MLEVCVDSLEGALIAIESGAQRIELSENLVVGGVTPSTDLIQAVRASCGESLIVLVRCRAGDFKYRNEELRRMIDQASEAIGLGADGVAIGASLEDCSLDWDFLIEAHRAVKSVSQAAWLVVHRVFDQVPDPIGSIERLIQIGYDRILTSGGAEQAVGSLDALRRWQIATADRLEILPAGGVHSGNAQWILESTGCRQLHGSFTRTAAGQVSRMPDRDEIAKVRRVLDGFCLASQG
jgi:copper homeostasis protein